MATTRFEHTGTITRVTSTERLRCIWEPHRLLYDTTLGVLYVGDGATTGGLRVQGVLVDSEGNEVVGLTGRSSAVNYVNITNAATNVAPSIAAAGDDTNVSLALAAKGTGIIALAAALAGYAAGSSPLKLASVSITPSADADITLTAAQYACPWILLAATGSWSSGHNVIVPTVSGAIFFVVNRTSYTATVKTAAGTGIGVATGKAQILLCDGTNVVALGAAA